MARINKELNADLDVLKFKHSPEYIKEEGIAKSYLESKENQTISIGHLVFEFKAGEKIHTEISRKYNDDIIKAIFRDTNFIIMDKIMDSKSYFADYILKKI